MMAQNKEINIKDMLQKSTIQKRAIQKDDCETVNKPSPFEEDDIFRKSSEATKYIRYQDGVQQRNSAMLSNHLRESFGKMQVVSPRTKLELDFRSTQSPVNRKAVNLQVQQIPQFSPTLLQGSNMNRSPSQGKHKPMPKTPNRDTYWSTKQPLSALKSVRNASGMRQLIDEKFCESFLTKTKDSNNLELDMSSIERIIEQNQANYESIMQSPMAAYKSQFNDLKSLQSSRQQRKKSLMQVTKEIQNTLAVNRYLESKIYAYQGREEQLESEIGSVRQQISILREKIVGYTDRFATDMARIDNERHDLYHKIDHLKAQNRDQADLIRESIIAQKNEIINIIISEKAEQLSFVKDQAFSLQSMYKKLYKAEEYRMAEVVKANSKIR